MRHSGITHLQIGKNGITQGVITDLKSKFESTDPLVVKMNSAFCDTHDRKAAAQELARRTDSTVQSHVGGTVVLTRKH